jgi:uncharacterized RDD family membrane protein YckC
MKNKFAKVMSEMTDEELIKIVTIERDEYQPLGVEAAESEIKKRNIDTSKFEEIKKKAKAEKELKVKIDSYTVGTKIRFLNFIIDFIIWLIMVGIFTFPLNANNGIQMLLGYLILLGTFIGYYAIMEIKFQKTVGKFVTKTRVIKLNGQKPQNSDIISRTFCRLIPFDRISFVFFKNGIHDILSKTKVVKDSME